MDLLIDPYRAALVDLAKRLDDASHGDRREIVMATAPKLGRSTSTVYRDLKKLIGWDSGRKARADKGKRKVTLTQARLVAGLLREGKRLNGKETIGTEQAKMLANMGGLAIDASVSTINRVLREERLSKLQQRIPRAHVEQQALHPNHVHQCDPSICVLYYAGGKQHIMEQREFNKNKPHNFERIKLKLLRYVYEDRASGMKAVRYYEARGENQTDLLDFIQWCWSKQEGRTFQGVPKVLYVDPGSANGAHSVKAICDAHGVRLIPHAPGNAQAKGGIEKGNDTWERGFESMLLVQPVNNADELNAYALAYQEAYNANRIPDRDCRLRRAGFAVPMVRVDLWLLIKADELRLPAQPHQWAQIAHTKPVERRVNPKKQVTYRHPLAQRTMTYDLRHVDGLCVGDYVTVSGLVYGDHAVLVRFKNPMGIDRTFQVDAINDWTAFGFRASSPIIGESYKSLPKDDAMRREEALDELAYRIDGDGVVRSDEELAKAKAKRATPFAHLGLRPLDHIKGIQQRTNLPRKGTQIVPNVPEVHQQRENPLEAAGLSLNVPSQAVFATRRLNTFEASCVLQPLLGDAWNADAYALLTQWFPDGLPEDQVNQVADRLRAAAQRGRMQIINGGAA